MRILKFIFPVLLAFCFTGCLDVYETIEVKANGSGQLSMDVDMSQMVELMRSNMTKEELQKNGIEKMDTTILLKDIVDTSTVLSAEKKALLHPASIHINLDIDGKVFKTHMLFPFSSQDNLQKLYATTSDGSLGNAQLLRNMLPGGGQDGGVQQGGPSPDINQFNGVYDFTSKDGVMTKKLNADKWKALQDNPIIAQAKQAGQMGVTIDYTTTIKLPRPVKKVDNPSAKLSDDRKTVTIKFNLIEIFDHPEEFGYTIEY